MSSQPSNHELALSLKEEGNALFKQERYKEAAARYEEAAKADASIAAIWSNLAACYEKLKSFSKMINAAQSCLEADPTFVKGYHRKALAHKHVDELKEALATLESGLKIKPGNMHLEGLKTEVEVLIDIVKCQRCGEPNATSPCSKCRRTYYCSRKCQVDDWKQHKRQCCPFENQASCQNCYQDLTTYRVCSKCEKVTYCSRTCQLDHWPTHKLYCKKMVRREAFQASQGNANLSLLFSEWRRRARDEISIWATHGMTKAQYLERPPSFVTRVNVSFDYNFMTFLPVGNPISYPISGLSDNERPLVMARRNEFEQSTEKREKGSLYHIFIIALDESMGVEDAALASSFSSGHPFHLSSFQSLTKYDLINMIRRKHNLNPDQSASWAPMEEENLLAQFTGLRNGLGAMTWTKFIVHAFRLGVPAEENGRLDKKSKALIVHYEYGFGLGKVETLTKFELVPVEKARKILQRCGHDEDFITNRLDTENSPALIRSRIKYPRDILIPIVFKSLKGFFSQVSFFTLEAFEPLSAKDSDSRANEYFLELQQICKYLLPQVTSPDVSTVRLKI